MLKASSSILCRNLTTGASSTSDGAASSSSSMVDASIVDSSNSKSSPMMLSIASVAVAVAASTILDSLSYSAMIQSTPIWVANLIFSAACWSDGSAVATIRRLLRLLSTTTRKAWQILVSSRFLGSRCRSIGVQVQQGRAEGGGHGVRQIGRRDRARSRSARR